MKFLSVDAFRKVMLNVDNKMRNRASLVKVRREIQESVLEALKKLSDHAQKIPLEGRVESIGLTRIHTLGCLAWTAW